MPRAEDSTALRQAKASEDATGKDVKEVVKLKHRLIPRKLKHKLKLKHTLKLSFGTEAPVGDKDKVAGTGSALEQVRLMNEELKTRLKEHCVRHPFGVGVAETMQVISRLDALGNKFAESTTDRSGGKGHALSVRRLAQRDEGIMRECRPRACTTLT